jgi:ABC-type multidrug transport system fused ATPase/permease subunit
MDPTGEFELFRNLREARVGRTMIFITHRFGHLTKHADVILCVAPQTPFAGFGINTAQVYERGRTVEVGTHYELLAKKGEYASLYQIQAQAFTAVRKTDSLLATPVLINPTLATVI